MSFKSGLIKRTFLLGGRLGIGLVISIISQSLLLKHYDPSEYGKYLLSISFGMLVSSVVVPYEFLLNRYLPVYEKENDLVRLKTLLRFILKKVTIQIIVVFLGWVVISYGIRKLGITTLSYGLFLSGALLIPIIVYRRVVTQFLISKDYFVSLGALTIGSNILFLCCVIILVNSNTPIHNLFVVRFLADLLLVGGTVYMCKSELFTLFGTVNQLSTNEKQEYTNYVLPLYKSSLLNQFYIEGSRIIVGSMLSTKSLSLYNFARTNIDQLTNLFYSLPQVLLPVVQRNFEDSQKQAVLMTVYKWVILLSCFTYCALFLFAEKFTILVAGRLYGESVLLIYILGLQILFQWPANICGIDFNINNKTFFFLKVSICKLVIDVISVFILANYFDEIGVVFANLFGYIVASFLVIEYFRRQKTLNYKHLYCYLFGGLLATSIIVSFIYFLK